MTIGRAGLELRPSPRIIARSFVKLDCWQEFICLVVGFAEERKEEEGMFVMESFYNNSRN